MAASRKARLHRVPDCPEDPAPPTPQTVARLRHDVVGRLVARGRLRPSHAEAAEEIRAVCEAVGRGMSPTAQPSGWTGRPGFRRAAYDFWDRMSARERWIWQCRYLPWTREMVRAADLRLPGRRFLRLVLDIVVENTGLRTAERRYGLRNGTAVACLARGLDRYGSHRGRRGRGEGFG